MPDQFSQEAARNPNDFKYRISRIMTADVVELLAKEYQLCDEGENIHNMLLYLHDLGEIVYHQKDPCKGIVITQVEWLLNIIRSVIHLDEKDAKGLAKDEDYEKACKTGIMSESYIRDVLVSLKVEEPEKQIILELMESYDITCKIQGGQPNRYFMPYLLGSKNQEFDSNGFYESGWLYVGFKPDQVPYIPDGILYCLLVSCLKQWEKSDIEAYYECAKYRLEEDCYDIVVKKEGSYIGIYYRYRLLPEDAHLKQQIKDKVKKSIDEKKPYQYIRDKLKTLVQEKMFGCGKLNCSYFIKCPSCK